MPETNSTRLDPAILESCRDVFGRYFPWDTTRALELGVVKNVLYSLNFWFISSDG